MRRTRILVYLTVSKAALYLRTHIEVVLGCTPEI